MADVVVSEALSFIANKFSKVTKLQLKSIVKQDVVRRLWQQCVYLSL